MFCLNMVQILTRAIFGPILRLARAHARVSQVDLAIRIGVSPSRIGRLEASVSTPRPHELEAIAAELPLLAHAISAIERWRERAEYNEPGRRGR